jgi:hypothetical protein
MEQLSILDEQYINCKSYIELINSELISQEKKPLPTYLIIPKKQLNDDKEVIDRYGYIEFISHSPWHTINCVDYLEKLVRETAPCDKREINGKVEKYYNQKFEIMLTAASNDSSCNYILRTKNEEDDFSFACGCLITVMTTLGIIDMHVENMIVSNKLPILIDLESSFKIDKASTIEKTLAFQVDRGSFSHKSTAPKEYAHLYNITGLQTPTIDMIEKNRSYTIFKIKDDKPIPYALDNHVMAHGISAALEIFKHKHKEFSATEYGADFDLFPFIMGQLDERFKTKILFNLIASGKRFDDFAEAMKLTSRRGVSSNSAFVIGLKCSVEEIDSYREKGELSNLIISITNAITKQPVTENSVLLKPKNKDNSNSD